MSQWWMEEFSGIVRHTRHGGTPCAFKRAVPVRFDLRESQYKPLPVKRRRRIRVNKPTDERPPG